MESRHQKFTYPLTQSTLVEISSEFDTGNLQIANLYYKKKIICYPALDAFNSLYSYAPSSKTFFHFRLSYESFQATNKQDQEENQQQQKAYTFDIRIRRMKILQYFNVTNPETSLLQHYYLCIGYSSVKSFLPQTYTKIRPKNLQINTIVQHGDDDIQLSFEYSLKKGQFIYFAYHFPYSFQKYEKMLIRVSENIDKINMQKVKKNEEIKNNEKQKSQKNCSNTEQLKQYLYFRKQLLIQSLEKRPVHLLTLTSLSPKQETNYPLQSRISKSLFPLNDLEPRCFKFEKPIVFLSCRVHPGQSSASFTLEGILNYLLDTFEEQTNELLKMFVFKIVPMINVDGVYHGCYRMDTQGQNLNRFYNSSVSHKQPAIFAIQTILGYYSQKIIFYLDMHSHPHPNKGSFFYGNSFNNIYEQVESQIYAKMLSKKDDTFSYSYSSFSPIQMVSKDVNEILTKEGSGRVYAFRNVAKNSVLPHCYTLQAGYHGYWKKTGQRVNFDTQHYTNLGKNLMETLLEMYTNVISPEQNESFQIYKLREQLAKEIYDKQQRFKQIDSSITKKIKNINAGVYQHIYTKLFATFPSLQNTLKKNKLPISRQLQSEFRKTKQHARSPQDKSGSKEVEKSKIGFKTSKEAMEHFNDLKEKHLLKTKDPIKPNVFNFQIVQTRKVFLKNKYKSPFDPEINNPRIQYTTQRKNAYEQSFNDVNFQSQRKNLQEVQNNQQELEIDSSEEIQRKLEKEKFGRILKWDFNQIRWRLKQSSNDEGRKSKIIKTSLNKSAQFQIKRFISRNTQPLRKSVEKNDSQHKKNEMVKMIESFKKQESELSQFSQDERRQLKEQEILSKQQRKALQAIQQQLRQKNKQKQFNIQQSPSKSKHFTQSQTGRIKNQSPDRIVLPKITYNRDPLTRKYDMQIKMHKRYEKKYNVQVMKIQKMQDTVSLRKKITDKKVKNNINFQ